MSNENHNVTISKFLSLVLRHKPEIIGIDIDENGWTEVSQLIEKSKKHGVDIDFEILSVVVATSDKKRFAFDETQNKIRANQRHSLKICLGYSPKQPPEILYHGTGVKFVSSILSTGLKKQERHHVHLSNDIETALSVGQRHGKPFVFIFLAEQMFLDKFEFYLSDNGVWLTESVPTKYLKHNGDK